MKAKSSGALRALGTVAVLSMLIAGCSSESTATDSAPAESPASAAAPESQPAAASAEASAEAPGEDEAGQLTAWPGPNTSPPIVEGNKLSIISCTNASASCKFYSDSMAEAATALGWDATVIDGKGAPPDQEAAIQSAIQNGADVIALVAVVPDLVKPALLDAQEAGVTVVETIDIGAVRPDGDETGGVPVVAAIPWKAQGEQHAQWIASDSGGDGKIVIVRSDEFPGNKLRQDSLKAKLAETCPGCQVLEEVQTTGAEGVTPAFTETITGVLNRHPDVEYIVASFDAGNAFGIQALQDAGRTDVKYVDYDGDKTSFGNCRTGLVDAIAVTLLEWGAWGSVDNINRLLQGEERTNIDTPTFELTEADCAAAPESIQRAEETVPVDFKTEYKNVWGVG